ncbi:MAG: penicillin-binding protein 1C [Gemmatimonadales bacterium]
MRFGWRRPWRRRAARVLLAGGLGFALWLAVPPGPDRLAPPTDDGLVLTDRAGLPLRATRAADGSRQRWLAIDAIDPDLLVAFVAAEDRRFFGHLGVDPIAVARALRSNVRQGRVVSGASTITMQVARLVAPSGRHLAGKLRQAAWALRLERHLTKQAILEQYLNRVPLGEAAVGVDAAARLYFGASASDLGLGQAAMLAGLASAPSRVNPLRDPAGALRRRDQVLDRLQGRGYALGEDVDRARMEPAVGAGTSSAFLAPHFTSWVLGRDERLAGTVRTSIDGSLQQSLEAEVRHTVRELGRHGAEQAAAVVLDNRSGEILAWVGSPDFFAESNGQVDMVVSPRQPGSTLKPFLYGMAFDRGHTPASILADVATVYPTAAGSYAPRNYDRRYRGPVRAREALGSSLNVPAVALAARLGVPPFLETLRRAGFGSLSRRADHYGLGLALGSGEVTLLELANGYRALAAGGRYRPVRWRAGAREAIGSADGVSVISAEAAAQVIDILADPTARIAGFGMTTPLEFPFRAAAKTGTSRHFTDNWAVATTEGFTVAVWVGNFTGRPMNGVSGVTGAGPLLQRAVLATAARHPAGSLPTPADLGLAPVPICRLSGLAATGACPSLVEWFRPGTEPGPDTWFQAAGLSLPSEYREWEGRSESGNGAAAGVIQVGLEAPTGPGLRITSIREGDRYRLVPGVDPAFQTVGLRATASGARVQWFVDGSPYRSGRWRLVPGRHQIRVVAGAESHQVNIEVLP